VTQTDPYRNLVENAPYGIFRTTRSGRILQVNPALVRMLGYPSREALLEVSASDLYADPAERDRILREEATDPYRRLETLWRRADGRTVAVRLSGRPVQDGEGPDTVFETFVEDVTEWRRTEERLKRALASSGALLYALVPDEREGLRPLWVSESIRQVLGYTPEEALAAGWFMEGLHPDDREAVRPVEEEVVRGQTAAVEFRFRHADGHYLWFQQSMRRIDGDAAAPEEIVGVWVDVTARKVAERAAAESRERYRRLVEAAPEGIVTVDRTGRIVEANAAAQRMFRMPGADMERTPFTELFPEEFREENRSFFERILSEEGGLPLQAQPMRGLRSDGRDFSAEVSITVHGTGEDSRVTAILRDVTERRRLEDERERLIEELRQALRDVRTLQGILPICASCKKIRDDTGYWQKVESFVRARADVEFSHGICPECEDELYGDLDQPPADAGSEPGH